MSKGDGKVRIFETGVRVSIRIKVRIAFRVNINGEGQAIYNDIRILQFYYALCRSGLMCGY